jgi:tetratricopeptide (TPR) repeat protein
MKPVFALVACAFLLLSVVHSVVGQENISEQAAAAYESEEYDAAIRLYESVLASGAQDGSVFYNLGAAYYQAGDLARALINYRRAQNFIPRDNDLATNIALIRVQRLDVQGDETGLVESLSGLTSGFLTMTELFWIALVSWALWFALLSAAILRGRLREMLRGPLLIFGILALAGLLFLGSRLYAATSIPSAVVVEPTVSVMSGPGEDFLEIFQLHGAAEVHLLEKNADWVRFSLPDGRQGWIPAEAVETV